MASPSLGRRVYDSVALVALLNVLGVGALVGFLVKNGGMTAEKFRALAMVIRGEGVVVVPEPEAGEGAADDSAAEKDDTSSGIVSQTDMEVLRLEAERIKTEMDQRLALNNSIMLRVMTERERFKREQEESAQRQAASQEKREGAGFKKQLAILEGLPPKLAVKHLLDMNDPDEAARILLELETSQAKKIVESAKRGQDMVKMENILRRVRDVEPRRAGDLKDQNG